LPIDLRIVFLVLAAASGLLLLLSGNAPPLTLGQIGQIFVHFLLVPAVVLTVVTFAFLLTRTDPFPMIREGAYQLGLQQLVSFEHAIPDNLADNISVRSILREDTDGDGFREWVVFYRFDTREMSSPIQAIIYDNDRGNPPVIFAYALRPPARDYVSEDALLPPTFELEQITADQNGPGGSDLPEIVIHGPRELSIFRFRENSEPWDFPRDAPPRYESVGFFRGSGGVTIDLEDNIGDVSVVDRNGFERSQLAVRSTFRVNPVTNSYWDQFYGPTELDRMLAPPVFSTIDFFGGPPDDILDSAFPEKVVLGFYVANCAGENSTLCVNAMAEWLPEDFLAGDALAEFQNSNSGYFGLPNFGGVQDLAVVHLHYYPSLETDPDLLELGGGRDVVTREESQFDVVDISFVADGAPLQTFRYQMNLVNGRWKITQRLAVDAPLAVPSQIQTAPQP
jgi:hypothetical protein